MFNKILQNTRKPADSWAGRFMLKGMNKGHDKVASWGFEILDVPAQATVCDIGCGGGRNIERLLQMTKGSVYGIDHSPASVEFATSHNARAVEEGRCKIACGSVSNLPYDDESFDDITAFETVYFWPRIQDDFKEVFRCLKPHGHFLVCNEDIGTKIGRKYESIIEGMKVYTPDELKQLLTQAGFAIETLDIHPNGRWIRICAVKP